MNYFHPCMLDPTVNILTARQTMLTTVSATALQAGMWESWNKIYAPDGLDFLAQEVV